METRQIAQQMVDFQKSIFESSFTTLAAMQDYTEKTMNEQAGKVPWVTEDGKKSVSELYGLIKKWRNSFKQSVDEGYVRLGEIVASTKAPVAQMAAPIKTTTANKTTAVTPKAAGPDKA